MFPDCKPPAPLTCGPGILCTRPGSWRWRRWSSCLSPPPAGPGHRLWRTLCSDQCGKGWSPTPALWSAAGGERSEVRSAVWDAATRVPNQRSQLCTMSSQACLPSMKPLGMALGVRISYLEEGRRDFYIISHLKKWKLFSWCEETSVRQNRLCHLCLNSWKMMRLGKPCLQMRIPSRTPLHLNWSRTRWGSSLPACRTEERSLDFIINLIFTLCRWGSQSSKKFCVRKINLYIFLAILICKSQ